MKQSDALTRRALVVGAAAVMVAPQASATDTDALYPYQRLGQTAPAFDLTRFGGGIIHSERYRGKTLLLSFGGLWCPDCIVEEQELNRLASLAAADRHLAFLALHCGDRYGRWGVRAPTVEAASAAVTAYRAEMHTAYPLAFDLDMSVAEAFGLTWFPTTLIIDRRGIVRGFSTDLRAKTPEAFLAEARAVSAQH